MNGQNHRIGNTSSTANGGKQSGPQLKKRNTFANGNIGGERLWLGYDFEIKSEVVVDNYDIIK